MADATTNLHINDERTVHCPVEECDETPLARGVHLHILRSVGNGHGDQGEVPPEVSLDNLVTAGASEVAMDYPERRDTEEVARLCPYCEQPFTGKHGVLIHLGQVRGRKNHPEVYPDELDPSAFPIVHLDEHDNIVEVIEEGESLPSTKRRRASDELPDRVEQYISELREAGKLEEAARAEQVLCA